MCFLANSHYTLQLEVNFKTSHKKVLATTHKYSLKNIPVHDKQSPAAHERVRFWTAHNWLALWEHKNTTRIATQRALSHQRKANTSPSPQPSAHANTQKTQNRTNFKPAIRQKPLSLWVRRSISQFNNYTFEAIAESKKQYREWSVWFCLGIVFFFHQMFLCVCLSECMYIFGKGHTTLTCVWFLYIYCTSCAISHKVWVCVLVRWIFTCWLSGKAKCCWLSCRCVFEGSVTTRWPLMVALFCGGWMRVWPNHGKSFGQKNQTNFVGDFFYFALAMAWIPMMMMVWEGFYIG